MNIKHLLKKADIGINQFLEENYNRDIIDKQLYEIAKENTILNLSEWLNNMTIEVLSPKVKKGIADAINNSDWENLVNSFRQYMNFGTGGIRGLMAFDKESIVRLKKHGLDADILKGTNTLNNIVLLLTSAGVAKYGLDRGFSKIVIGYDSRIRGYDFAKIISELFLYYDYTVYLFDDPCPYPEVTYAIPYKDIKADIGILISASHNDYRYNGYKLSCGNGSQFDPEEREEMYNDYIMKSRLDDLRLTPIQQANPDKIHFLGGGHLLDDFNYFGHTNLMDIHKEHREHVKSFLLLDNKQTNVDDHQLNIAYCAFHGAGRIAVPRLLKETGFDNVKVITKNGLNELDGLFPSFESSPGHEQQPDPGDVRAATIAVNAFKEEYPGEWENIDILIGTDPDADRCGVVVKVPEDQQFLYDSNDWMLLPADDMWALIVWFRLITDKSIDLSKTFIVQSHTTCDNIIRLVRKKKYQLGAITTWVGFASLAAGTRMTWDQEFPQGLVEGKIDYDDELCNPFIHSCISIHEERTYNLAAMEQSNGFSILGSPPPDNVSLGVNGHVRDKDGTFAAILIAEIAEWAKENGTTLYQLIDEHIHLDPEIGLFINYYEPDPMDGEYPGIVGDRKKKAILRRALGLYQFALAGDLEIGGYHVKSASVFRTGKYDQLYPVTPDFKFPDEGIRFYFDDERLNHVIIRPSGTTNSLRFHVQLHSDVNERNLADRKKHLSDESKKITDHIRELVGAPRK